MSSFAYRQEHLRSWFRLLDAGGDIPGTPAAKALTAQVQQFLKARTIVTYGRAQQLIPDCNDAGRQRVRAIVCLTALWLHTTRIRAYLAWLCFRRAHPHVGLLSGMANNLLQEALTVAPSASRCTSTSGSTIWRCCTAWSRSTSGGRSRSACQTSTASCSGSSWCDHGDVMKATAFQHASMASMSPDILSHRMIGPMLRVHRLDTELSQRQGRPATRSICHQTAQAVL